MDENSFNLHSPIVSSFTLPIPTAQEQLTSSMFHDSVTVPGVVREVSLDFMVFWKRGFIECYVKPVQNTAPEPLRLHVYVISLPYSNRKLAIY